ncbi:MAG: hypothetical protein LUM44_09790 [Pyrinomonadaceae bacterium]|nr:hypothetical protein [Pyrinomonadaceae bacterium]
MITNFIPKVWSAKILKALEEFHIFGSPSCANREYEGEIKDKGSSVKINSVGDIVIKDYTRGTDIEDPDELNDAGQELVITEAKYFNFAIDDVDRVQANANVMAEAMSRAGYGLRDKADIFIASNHIYVPSSNFVGDDVTPIIPTKDTFYDYLVDLKVKLTEANIPEEGRFAIIPPWCEGLLLKDDRFVAAGTSKTDEVLRNGFIGRAAGMDIYVSNNTPNTAGTKYKVIAGHPMALTFAEQIVKTVAYTPEKRFADAVKGLHVYGAKLVRPYAWAVGTFNKS